MKIQQLHAQHIEIPLRIRFAQANNSTQTSSTVIVTIVTQQGIVGTGETCPRPYVTGETIESVLHDLRYMQHKMVDRNFVTIYDIEEFVMNELEDEIGLAAICGLELALLDAWGKTMRIPLVKALGGNHRKTYRYSGVVPFGKLEKIQPILHQFQFADLKVKAGQNLQENIHRIQAIQESYRTPPSIRVDANGGWEYKEACQQIEALIQLGVTTIEQPLAPGRECEMAELVAAYGDRIQIMADESLCSLEQAHHLIQQEACTAFNLKISKNGGVFRTLQLAQLAAQHGISCQLGAHFGETSILTAAAMVVAALTPNIKVQEGGLGTILLESDICTHQHGIDYNACICLNGSKEEPGLVAPVNPALLHQYHSKNQGIPQGEHQG